ncbi:MAG: TonB-dependent receptor [Proteobacteria bacterium]|nr:TonB-dependent receptor [Pseudomonadota bacterium]
MTVSLKSLLRNTTILGTAAMASGLWATAAIAQTAETTADQQSNEIVVTGSRIARPEANVPNPLVTVSSEQITDSGTTNLTDYLKSIPALAGSQSSYDNSGDRANIGTTGLNLLDLRNLGADRTLVLIDGRRQVAAVDGTQSVDINTIPSDLIERVEVSTGGASAVYGADGVSGVVNFIMKKNFSGITGRAQAGISGHGDAGQRLISLTAGHNFADGRGNIAIAWEHGEEDRLQTRDRDWMTGTNRIGFYRNAGETEASPDASGGDPDYIPLNNIRYNDTSRAGGIDVDWDGIPDFYGANGAVYDRGTFVPDYYQQGGSGTLVSDYGNDLLPQIRRDVFNGLAHFDVSPALTLYAEAKYAKTKSYSLGQPSFDYYLVIPEDNPFIPAAVRPFIDPALGGVMVNRDNFDLGQRGEDITRETIRTVVGAKGSLSDHLKYDVSWVYGRAKITSHYIGDILTDRYYAAIDAVQGPNGITCRVNLDPTWTPNQPYNYTRNEIPPTTFTPGQCLPLNLFGEGLNSQAALDWIKTDTTDRSRLTQNVVNASITGDTGGFFKLPGGPVGFAIGGEYRKETSSFVADPLAQQGLTFTNVLGNTTGKFDVWEAFGEVAVPLLSDRPFFHRLELEGALRYSHYSSIGNTTAWKLGGTWAPVRDIAFRGTWSRAVRAPNIGELYGARSQTFEFIDDPCGQSYLIHGTQYRVANCQTLLSGLGVANPGAYNDTRSVNIPGYSGGNPNVKQEAAKTWTAGVVLQPRFIPRLVLTADWYDIRIENAINTVDAQTVADLCVDQPTLANQYCAAITRQNGGQNAGFITGFEVGPVNVANFRTAGLDVMLDYRIPTERLGTFSVHMVGNYLNKLTFIPIPGSPPVDSSEQPYAPKYQASVDLGWKMGRVKVSYGIDYFSKVYRYKRQTVATDPDIVAPQYLKLKPRWQHDINVGVDVNDDFEFFGGVRNLFDQKPDIGSLNYPISAVGRYFYAGVKVKMGK